MIFLEILMILFLLMKRNLRGKVDRVRVERLIVTIIILMRRKLMNFRG